MKNKLIIVLVGLLTVSFCSACMSEAERQRIAAEKQRQAEIARVEAEKAEKERKEREAKEAAEHAERERLARIEAVRLEQERVERERLARIEAVRLEQERVERERIARIEEIKAEKQRQKLRQFALEKELVVENLTSIIENDRKISANEAARGNAILEAFADKYLPLFAKKYKAMYKERLEAEENFKELVLTLKADGSDPGKNETARLFFENLKKMYISYWTIRYKINDYYSKFTIGVISADDLSKADKELSSLY